uniref:Orf112a n=1 Tax=Batis maritima TaxID=4436 RepID=A0A068BE34_BATMA|nr:orf112a [Batis maritima]AIC83331.1 orf112a [Batis maritima]
MNRSYFRVRVRTSISPYRGSTCYKRRAAPFQNIHIGPHRKGDEKSPFTLTIFRNVSWPYLFIFFFKKKRVPHLSGGTNRRGEEGEGGYEPSPVAVPGPTIPSFPFAPPGEVR